MSLEELLDLIPLSGIVCLNYGEKQVTGDCDSLFSLLSKEVLAFPITNVEARGRNILWVWLSNILS